MGRNASGRKARISTGTQTCRRGFCYECRCHLEIRVVIVDRVRLAHQRQQKQHDGAIFQSGKNLHTQIEVQEAGTSESFWDPFSSMKTRGRVLSNFETWIAGWAGV